jgi:hypothetical protein
VNLRIPGVKPVPVTGSGRGGKVELGDIRAKLVEIRGDIDQTVERNKPVATYVAVGGSVALVVLAFLLGRSRGKRKATWVEIRRL